MSSSVRQNDFGTDTYWNRTSRARTRTKRNPTGSLSPDFRQPDPANPRKTPESTVEHKDEETLHQELQAKTRITNPAKSTNRADQQLRQQNQGTNYKPAAMAQYDTSYNCQQAPTRLKHTEEEYDTRDEKAMAKLMKTTLTKF